MSFENKVILVTGGSTGIGAAIAKRFSEEKAKIIIVGRDKTSLDEVASVCTRKSGHECLKIVADLTKDSDVERIVTELGAYNELDVLINNAGTYKVDTIYSTSMQSFDENINVNLRAVFYLTKLCTPLLVKSEGNVVNISDVSTQKYFETALSEAISKGGLKIFTKYAATELASKKVRVNSIALGYVAGTKILERANLDIDKFKKEFKNLIPLKEYIKPEEAAELVLFVASEKAKNMTGQNVIYDNGFSL